MESRNLFDTIADHPKLAGFLACVAIAITFTPKVDVVATYIALFVAWIFGVGIITGLPFVKSRSLRRVKTLATALVLLLSLLLFAYWLPDKGSGVSVLPLLLAALLQECRVLLGFMERPWAQRCLYTSFGMILLASLQYLLREVVRIFHAQRIPNASSAGAKGFLDYKLQAEQGMANLSPIISDITKSIGKVGLLFNSAAVKISPLSSTQTQIRKIGRMAETLRQYSSKIDSKCSDLERNGEWIAEGTAGWLEWMSKQEGRGEVGQDLNAHLTAFASTLENNITIMSNYLTHVESSRGVSREMNEAIDAHISSIRRILNTTVCIRQSCLNALQLIESF